MPCLVSHGKKLRELFQESQISLKQAGPAAAKQNKTTKLWSLLPPSSNGSKGGMADCRRGGSTAGPDVLFLRSLPHDARPLPGKPENILKICMVSRDCTFPCFHTHAGMCLQLLSEQAEAPAHPGLMSALGTEKGVQG